MKKLNTKNSLFLTVFVVFCVSCSTENLQNKGLIVPQSSSNNFKFSTNQSIIIVPVSINGKSENFFFDTGSDYNVIHVDKVKGITTKVNGADGKKVKVGTGKITSLKIGETEFKKTFTWELPMDFLVDKTPSITGFIGQSVICKANWLIDFTQNTMEFSDKAIEISGFETFSMKNIRDPHLNLVIEGETISALIDLGSSSTLSIPKGSALAEKLLSKYSYRDNQREKFVAGGVQNVTEKLGITPNVVVGGFSFDAVETTIVESSQPRVGNNFFKNFALYIDNTNGVYKLKKIK